MQTMASRRGGMGLSAGWVVGVLIALGACSLSVPPMRSLIEQSMLIHMAVQIPLLLVAGWLLAGWLTARCLADGRAGTPAWAQEWDQFGLTSFMLAQLILSYWMLPLAIDRAVVLPSADLLKLLSLGFCGALSQRAMHRSPAALQLFFVGYTVSMLLAAGTYLATTDRRLCNAYALETQWNAGMGLIAVGAAVGAAWLWAAVSDARRQAPSTRGPTAP